MNSKELYAFIEIADAFHGKIVIVNSDYMKIEIKRTVDPSKRKDVRGFKRTWSFGLLPKFLLPNHDEFSKIHPKARSANDCFYCSWLVLLG